MRPTLLDNITHRELRLRPAAQLAAAATQALVPAVASEFRLLQSHYPIVFQRSGAQGGFQALALLGLREGHNLFVGADCWGGRHVPWALARQPLMVGRDGDRHVVHIDLDSPCLGATEGEPLFLPHGGQSDALVQRVQALEALHQGLEEMSAFIDALLQHRLLEPMHLDITQRDGSIRRLGGLYVIHEERLEALPGTAVAALHEAGHWLPMAMAVASLGRLAELIERDQAAGA